MLMPSNVMILFFFIFLELFRLPSCYLSLISWPGQRARNNYTKPPAQLIFPSKCPSPVRCNSCIAKRVSSQIHHAGPAELARSTATSRAHSQTQPYGPQILPSHTHTHTHTQLTTPRTPFRTSTTRNWSKESTVPSWPLAESKLQQRADGWRGGQCIPILRGRPRIPDSRHCWWPWAFRGMRLADLTDVNLLHRFGPRAS
ncbi:hypothetical protein LY78DRAFT_146261 [Colletotrichum sublineola]|nr:hypothetical protein LY78DRAFT_146261 [Colletotrichum sublineola]